MPRQPDKELMSWEAIGREIGVTGPGALKIYRRALEKIRSELRDNPAYAEEMFNLMQHEPEN
jgi:hypothetical protein